jgi:hypothetical protein
MDVFGGLHARDAEIESGFEAADADGQESGGGAFGTEAGGFCVEAGVVAAVGYEDDAGECSAGHLADELVNGFAHASFGTAGLQEFLPAGGECAVGKGNGGGGRILGGLIERDGG